MFSQITYGSAIKLMHEKTKFRLHSHDVPYGSGSGQQSVTGFPGVDDANSYWVCQMIVLKCYLLLSLQNALNSLADRSVISHQAVRSTDSSKQGDPIKSGSIIRLQHIKTRRWLHSHLHASPISGNMEVCRLVYFSFSVTRCFSCILFLLLSGQWMVCLYILVNP